jgi:glycosyltransferase involved in cell wall biosynthesis
MKKMNIIYTYDIFSAQKYGGISRYFFELIKQTSADKASIQVIAGLFINEYIKELSDTVIEGLKVPSLKHTGFLRTEINALFQRFMLSKCKNRDRTIVHQTYYSRFTPPEMVKYVITIHDMIHERFPKYCLDQDKISDLKKQCCERADKIIAISNSTKNDLISLFGIDPSKIVVIYHGSSLNEDSLCSSDTVRLGPYILYVGKRGGYKNFKRLLQAFSQSDILRNKFYLICFGDDPFDDNEKNELDLLGVSGLVYQISGDDRLLATYYKYATAFICPSLYEGFGIPLLEAMSLSCPVICSNTSSIPEVVGDAGIYFDPNNTCSIQSALEDTLFNENLLWELRQLGLERESMFSWGRCASETVEVYKSLLS